MNVSNLLGGGLVGMGLGWLACLLAIFFIPLPRIPLAFVLLLYVGSALSAFGVGVGILSGGIGPFGLNTDFYALSFVASQFVGTWGFTISFLLFFFRNNTIVNSTEAQDTNTRIREMQTRGQGDAPLEQSDRDEGHEHRSSIDKRLEADTDARTEERKLDREERAEERREDREERAEERQSERDE